MVSGIDVGLIAAYFAAILAIAYFSSRKLSKQGYLIAERNLGLWDTVATITASKIATGVITVYAALVFVFGIGAIWVFVGYCLGYLIFYFFAKRVREMSDKHHFFTLADYYRQNYGKTNGLIVGALTLLNYFFSIVIQLVGGAKILSLITGLTYTASVVIVAAVIFLYLYMGGFSAMVKTDTIQYAAMVLLLFALSIIMTQNFVFEPSDWNLMSVGAKELISFFLAGLMIPLSTVDLYQRVFAAKSQRVVKKGIIIASAFFLVLGSLLTWLVLISKGHVAATIDPDLVLVEGFMALLPAGIIGLGIVAVFAIVMSSADTYLFTTSSIVTHDFYSHMGRFSDEKLVKFMKRAMLIFVIAAALMSLVVPSLLDIAYLFVGVTMVLSLASLTTWVRKSISKTSLAAGMVTGSIALAVFAVAVGIEPTIGIAGMVASLAAMILAGALKSLFGLARHKNFRQ